MEVGGLWIDSAEHAECIDDIVLVSKESPNVLPFVIVDTQETLLGLFLILLDERLVYVELLNAIQSGILELLRTGHAVRLHRLAHL